MLLQGGDTDTNAAIVGGLLGAAQGMKAIPEDMVNKVLQYNYQEHGGYDRPNFLVPNDNQGQLIKKLKHVFENCPRQLSVKWRD